MRALTIGALAVFWLHCLLFNVAHVSISVGVADFACYYYAARVADQQGNPYDIRAIETVARQDGYRSWLAPYLYPPLFVEMMLPLAQLDLRTARYLWLFLSVAALWGAFRLLRAGLDPPMSDEERTVFTVFLATFWAFGHSLLMGQVNELILVSLACWLYFRRSTWKAGAFLGFAISIKMSPAILVLFLIMQRSWREAAMSVATAGLLIVGSAVVLGSDGLFFFREVLGGFVPGNAYHGLGIPLDLPGNNSLGALAYQLAGDPSDHLRLPPAGRAIHLSLAATLVACWAWRSWRAIPWEASLAGLMVLLIILPSYAYDHHMIFLMIPAALLIRLGSRGLLPSRTHIPLAIAVGMMIFADIAYEPIVILSNTVPALVGPSRLPRLLPVLVIFAVCMVVRRREEAAVAAPSGEDPAQGGETPEPAGDESPAIVG